MSTFSVLLCAAGATLVAAKVVSSTLPVTIQTCFAVDKMPSEEWSLVTLSGSTVMVQQGSTMCISTDPEGGVGIVSTPCNTGDNSQQWTFRIDGTVESVAQQGLCWNVWGGSVAPGTIIGLYTCDSSTNIAANDMFEYNTTTRHIAATESGLCLSTELPPCQTDVDCFLNGVCNATVGTCTCYAPWSGNHCGNMDLLPVNPVQGYGMQPNMTSWGGNVVFYEGLYHLYVAEMVNHCPLSDWSSNSQVSHAVSATPVGPYNFSDTALPVWAHNPHVVMFQNISVTTFALFHIGGANGGNPANCTTEEVTPMHTNTMPARRLRNAAQPASALHISTSPYGPWTPVIPGPQNCNNPAPMLHPNGTWFLLCDSTTLFSSDSPVGSWTQVTNIPSGGVPGTYEDAFLYLDQRGNWHVIYHVYNANTPCGDCTGQLVSGHSFSLDGLTWHEATESPYSNVIQFTNGQNLTVSTRERPKLMFDSNGNPTHLLNGVCGGTATCPPTPAVNCKYNYWDFTLVQPLAT